MLTTRNDVLAIVLNQDHDFVETPDPFLPEWGHYRVVSIKIGGPEFCKSILYYMYIL